VASSRYSAGLHAVARLVGKDAGRVRRLLVDRRSDNERIGALVREAEGKGIAIERVARNRLDDIAAGSRHQGVAAELHGGAGALDEAALRTLVEERLTAGAAPLLLILDGVQDPHNLGACLRTADGAGVDAVVVPRRNAAGITPAVRKVATGAAESLPLARVERLERVLRWLREYGVRVTGTADDADPTLFEADLTGPLALVLGGEEKGMAQGVRGLCDTVVSIPMSGCVESLNVSVAAGVCLYEALRQRRGTGFANRGGLG
jgi:23S rRNA (guanosine2251-2'-O)-methyltransferase